MLRLKTVLSVLLIFFFLVSFAQEKDDEHIDSIGFYRELPELGVLNIKKKAFFATVNIGAGIPIGSYVDGIDYIATFLAPQITISRRPTTGYMLSASFDKKWWKYFGLSVSGAFVSNSSDDTINRNLDYSDKGYKFVTAGIGPYFNYAFIDRTLAFIRVQGGFTYAVFSAAELNAVDGTTGNPARVDISQTTDVSYLLNISGGIRFLMSNTVTMNLELGYQHSQLLFENVETTVTFNNQPPVDLQSNQFKLNYRQLFFSMGVGIAF